MPASASAPISRPGRLGRERRAGAYLRPARLGACRALPAFVAEVLPAFAAGLLPVFAAPLAADALLALAVGLLPAFGAGLLPAFVAAPLPVFAAGRCSPLRRSTTEFVSPCSLGTVRSA